MLRLWLKTALPLAIFYYLLKLRAWLDWDKIIYDHAPGPCKQILKDGGAEDLTYIDDGNSGTVLFSHGFLLDVGKIMIMDVSVPSPTPRELNITNPPSTLGFMDSPHGISTWKDPKTGQITLFVITHPASGERVEVFRLVQSAYLRHIRTVTSYKFRQLNDLVAVDKDKFYTTQWSYHRNWLEWYLEIGIFRGSGEVLFFDGKKVRTVASDFLFTNGINISPDKSTIYVADFGNKRLVGFQRHSNNDLTKVWEQAMNTAVDNIEVDQKTGDLWIGCHPVMYRIVDFLRLPGIELPSNVLKVKMRDNMVDEIIEVYADNDGSEVFGATGATLVGDKLVIGTIYSQLVVCDVKHIE